MHENEFVVPANNSTGYNVGHAGDGIDVSYPKSQTRRGRIQKGISHTLTTGGGQRVITENEKFNFRVRRLTPLECWRLMGFDDNDYYKRRDVVSRSQLYKQRGNSIVVNVLEAIFNQLTENANNDGMNVSLFGTGHYTITKPVRLIELFARIGSQAKRLKRLNVDFETYRVIEWDKNCIKSYNAMHGTEFTTQDITKISGDDLGIVDTDNYEYIMTYSFPCQDLSIRGKRKGMGKGSGTRSGLLWEVERLLNETEHKPQILLMENVRQVHNAGNINDFERWKNALSEMGYSNHWRDLNRKNYGVPQNRNRCFMVSLLGDYDYIFPEPVELTKCLKDMLENDVDEKYFFTDEQLKDWLRKPTIDRINKTVRRGGVGH